MLGCLMELEPPGKEREGVDVTCLDDAIEDTLDSDPPKAAYSSSRSLGNQARRTVSCWTHCSTIRTSTTGWVPGRSYGRNTRKLSPGHSAGGSSSCRPKRSKPKA